MNDERSFLALPENDQMAVAWEAVDNAGLPPAVRDRYTDAVWAIRKSLLLGRALEAQRRLATTWGQPVDMRLLPRETADLVREVTTELRTQMGLGLLAWLFQPLVWKGVEMLVRLIVTRLLADWWDVETCGRAVGKL